MNSDRAEPPEPSGETVFTYKHTHRERDEALQTTATRRDTDQRAHPPSTPAETAENPPTKARTPPAPSCPWRGNKAGVCGELSVYERALILFLRVQPREDQSDASDPSPAAQRRLAPRNPRLFSAGDQSLHPQRRAAVFR